MDSISIREAAERLGVSHKVIRRLIAQGTLEAHKSPGAHGTEWRVSLTSLEAYRSGQTPSRMNGPSRVRLASLPSPYQSSASSPAANAGAYPPGNTEVESLRTDKAFLARQVESLTTLLSQALDRPEVLPVMEASQERPLEVHAQATGGVEAGVTAALQSSLRSIGTEGIEALEMCSVKVLWGKPVLWRVVAREAEDVARLLEALLAPEARWDLPGEEVVFVWALGPGGEVVWGTACGPTWFGPGFEESLRECHVERL